MALFDDKIPPVERLIAEPAVLRFLELLVNDVLCVTAGQAHQVLRATPQPGRSHHFHELVRDVLYKLDHGGYLGSECVARLPPPTIGSAPVFRMYRPDPEHTKGEPESGLASHDEPVYISRLPTAFAIRDYANLAKRRVPPLEAHRGARFYFATDKAGELFRSEKPASFGQYSQYKAPRIEERAIRLIEWHRTIETDPVPAPHDIACTNLTAMFNLNQVMFSEGFRSKLGSGVWKYSALGGGAMTGCDGTLSVEGALGVKLFFLRPLQPDVMLNTMQTWWADADYTSTCWWL